MGRLIQLTTLASYLSNLISPLRYYYQVIEVTKFNLTLRFTALASFIIEICYHSQNALSGRWRQRRPPVGVNMPRPDRRRRHRANAWRQTNNVNEHVGCLAPPATRPEQPSRLLPGFHVLHDVNNVQVPGRISLGVACGRQTTLPTGQPQTIWRLRRDVIATELLAIGRATSPGSHGQ